MKASFWRCLYSRIAAPLMNVIAHGLALKNQNLRAGLDGRQGLWQRLEQQLAARDPQKPLIWFHVASAGEFLQSQPVLERCMKAGYECAVTFTSVNGYRWIQRTRFAEGMAPLVKEYLPLDTAGNMRRMVNAMHAAAIVYVQYDLWPNLIWEARDCGIPQYLISATIQPKSHRVTSAPARSFYASLYACLDGIFTVTEADRQRFFSTNPDHPNIRVVGNTRFDSVLDRKMKVTAPQLPDDFSEKCIFIAGSSWPPDEECIFPALQEALRRYPDLLVIIAPHEPTEEHLRHSETAFQDFPLARLSALQPPPERAVRVIAVDTVGVLSALYSVATLAYVGGAFTTGVHNTMEPAAMGLPVIFGPKHENAPEAIDFVARKLAFPVNTPEEFRSVLFRLLDDPGTCRQLGQQAQQAIESQAGAADRCFKLITASK